MQFTIVASEGQQKNHETKTDIDKSLMLRFKYKRTKVQNIVLRLTDVIDVLNFMQVNHSSLLHAVFTLIDCQKQLQQQSLRNLVEIFLLS